MRRSSRAFTLVETLIAAVLGLLVTGMVFTFLVQGSRASTRSLVRIDMEERTILALNTVVADLEQTVKTGLSLVPVDGKTPPVLLSIVRIETVQDDGRQQFDTKSTLYVWDQVGGSLVRKVVDPGSAGFQLTDHTPLPLPDNVLKQMANQSSNDSQVLARGVTDFEISHGGTATNIDQPFTVTLRLEQPAATGRTTPETFQQTRSASLRNR